MKNSRNKNNVRVALVVPHIFLHNDILPHVIFSPGVLAVQLAEGLKKHSVDVTLFSPGPINTKVKNTNADMSYFESELEMRNDTYLDLLKKHPFIYVSLARQVQAEIIAKAYEAANNDEFDIVHIYTNEEDIALHFAGLCKKPVIFTHHDPYNFMVRYKSVFPKYSHLNYISFSYAQRKTMPNGTNWVGNVYHGLDPKELKPVKNKTGDYIAYFGRIIEPKGVHLAIEAVNKYNQTNSKPIKLKIAGKHYSDGGKDKYWTQIIQPMLNDNILYVGFINNSKEKNKFLGNAKALIIPSMFEEPFGMVMIEALACGTPLIGLSSGAIPEIINVNNGILVQKSQDEAININRLSSALQQIGSISPENCRNDFEQRFTLNRMCKEYALIYYHLLNTSKQ